MCRTVHAVLQTAICGIQMLVRVFMTIILMIENLIRMILQTLYNFISFLLQMISLIPICVVFLLTARLKCFMCGGGGGCPVNRGGACDCIMSALAIVILFFIFRATGVLDKIFYSLGYTKARPVVHRFVPTPGDITECSRNDTEYPEDQTTFTDSNADFESTMSTLMIDIILNDTVLPTDKKFDDGTAAGESVRLGPDVSDYASQLDSTISTDESIVEYSTPTTDGRFMELLRSSLKSYNLPSYVF